MENVYEIECKIYEEEENAIDRCDLDDDDYSDEEWYTA